MVVRVRCSVVPRNGDEGTWVEAGCCWIPGERVAVAVSSTGTGYLGGYFSSQLQALTTLGALAGLVAAPDEPVVPFQHGGDAFEAGRAAAAVHRDTTSADADRLRRLACDVGGFWRRCHELQHAAPAHRVVRVAGTEYLVRDQPHVAFRARDHAGRMVEAAIVRFGPDRVELCQIGGFALYRARPGVPLTSLMPVGMLGHPSCPAPGAGSIARGSPGFGVVTHQLGLLPDEQGVTAVALAPDAPLSGSSPVIAGDRLLLLSSAVHRWIDPAELERYARADSIEILVDRVASAALSARGTDGAAFLVGGFSVDADR